MKVVLSVIFLVLLIFSVGSAKRPRQQGVKCGRYEKEIKNSNGETKCIPNPGSCGGNCI